jgi:hypothetical protein
MLTHDHWFRVPLSVFVNFEPKSGIIVTTFLFDYAVNYRKAEIRNQ